jgi:hypothetical protein
VSAEYIETVTLRVPGHLKLEDENPYGFAEYCVKNAKRPDAIAWSVIDIAFHCSTVDTTRFGDRLTRRALGNSEWEITYEVLVPPQGADVA